MENPIYIDKPTKLHKLHNISKILNSNIYIKREDQSKYLCNGGNKCRKLEYIMDYALENNYDTVVNVVANCIDMVYDKEDVYDQFTREESVEFLNSMTQDQFTKVQGFFDTLPRLKHTITWTCPECGETDSVTVEGLQNFFT